MLGCTLHPIVATAGPALQIRPQDTAVHLGPQPAIAAGEGNAGELITRVYHVAGHGVDDAVMLAQQTCLDQPGKPSCAYEVKAKNWFAFTTSEAIQKKIAGIMKDYNRPVPTIDFRITLLLASDTPAPEPHVGAGERRALEDLKGFLPYKGYRLLDAGVIRSSGRDAATRLGTDPVYFLSMSFDRADPSQQGAVLFRHFVLQGHAGRPVLGSTFSMKMGETVVVGTSRLDGGKEALIVLLTAKE
ncbi:MAG: hypothetical protein ACE5ID_01860 [Acidobacteriota bacterium]